MKDIVKSEIFEGEERIFEPSELRRVERREGERSLSKIESIE